MRQVYFLRHWALTLLLAPLASQAIQSIWGPSPHQVVGLLEVYPVTLLFSFIFSLPTFLAYLASFYFLSKHDLNYTISKVILIGVSVSGIYITQSIIGGTMSQDIIIAYSVTAIFIGVILRIKKPDVNTQANPGAE